VNVAETIMAELALSTRCSCVPTMSIQYANDYANEFANVMNFVVYKVYLC